MHALSWSQRFDLGDRTLQGWHLASLGRLFEGKPDGDQRWLAQVVGAGPHEAAQQPRVLALGAQLDVGGVAPAGEGEVEAGDLHVLGGGSGPQLAEAEAGRRVRRALAELAVGATAAAILAAVVEQRLGSPTPRSTPALALILLLGCWLIVSIRALSRNAR